MKKRICGILFGLLCLLQIYSQDCQAAGRADFGVHNGKVIFRIRDFSVDSENYKILIFAKAEYQGNDLWVCVYSHQYDAEELVSTFIEQKNYIEGVPSVEKAALKLYADTEDGWRDCFGLCRSSIGSSRASYEVTIEEGQTAAESESEESELYVLTAEDQIVLPLELAEELYGFKADTQKNEIIISDMDDALAENMTFFSVEKEDQDGIVLSESTAFVLNTVQESESGMETEDTGEPELVSEAETESGEEPRLASETETEAEPKSETETAEETETETETEIETKTETEGMTEKKSGLRTASETEKETEEETEAASEAETETAEETESETASEAESETSAEAESRAAVEAEFEAETETEPESESETEPESESETQLAGEADSASEQSTEDLAEDGTEKAAAEEKGTSGGGFLALEVKVFLIVFALELAAAGLIWLFRKRKEEAGGKKASEKEGEDTITLSGTTSTALQKLTVQGAVVNSKGLVRGNNEDNFYFNGEYMRYGKRDDGASLTGESREAFQLYAVCDGMGGADAGEEASYKAVESLALLRNDLSRITEPKELTTVLRSISDDINEEAVQRGQKSGTTIAMVLIKDSHVILANVGDSRIYRVRNRELTQLSLDHSKVQRMIAMGLIRPEQAKTDPNRHVITQYLGMPTDVKISPYITDSETLKKDDVFLLCSDGLTDMIDDSEIEAILKQKSKPKDAAEELLKAALAHGGRDNVTIMVLRVKK